MNLNHLNFHITFYATCTQFKILIGHNNNNLIYNKIKRTMATDHTSPELEN